MALAEKHGLKVIEDCAQAHGARYKGRSVGSIGHIGAWSFCQDKIMTTGGEGGMVTTDDEALWRSMWEYKDHGKSYALTSEPLHSSGFHWVHESFGTNCRMLEMQAAIGRIQLRNIGDWSARRQANADALATALLPFAGTKGPVRLPQMDCTGCAKPCLNGCVHANYKFYIYVRPENLAIDWTRDRIIKAVNAEGVPCALGSCPEVYLEKAFDGTPWRPHERLPVAKMLGHTSLMFLVHPTLTQSDIDKTVDVIQKVLEAASR